MVAWLVVCGISISSLLATANSFLQALPVAAAAASNDIALATADKYLRDRLLLLVPLALT